MSRQSAVKNKDNMTTQLTYGLRQFLARSYMNTHRKREFQLVKHSRPELNKEVTIEKWNSTK